MTRRAVLLAILSIWVQVVAGQSATGSWYGRADVVARGSNSNYLTEFALKQKGDEVEGLFGYYFKDVYQSFFVRGTYDVRSRQLSIKNLPLLFYGSTSRNGIECPMHFQATLMVSKVSSILKGRFFTEPKYRYTCPELTVMMTLDQNENTDSTLRNTVAGTIFWKPSADDVIVSTNTRSGNDTGVQFASSQSTRQTQPVQQPDPEEKLTAEFSKRGNIYEKEIVVYDDSILVSFYDNGDIDDDTISVFLNKKPILVRRGLTARALNIYIGLDSSRNLHELSMFANNLGEFPPNTALMVISDRQMRYEFYLSASLKQNATVRLRRPGRR
jgi:hypothetical protein